MTSSDTGNEAREALYGAVDPPLPPPGPIVTCELVWIEVQALDETFAPVPGLSCAVTAPDGRVYRGNTDGGGLFRVDGLVLGDCAIAFPTLDRRTWDRV